MYFVVLLSYLSIFSQTQKYCAYAVGVREVLYFGWTLLSLWRNRAIFMVDLKASWKEHKLECFCYIFAPEKFVLIAIVGTDIRQPLDDIRTFLAAFFLPVLADFGGAVAFVFAFITMNISPAIMVWYTIATLETIYVAGRYLYEWWYREDDDDDESSV